MKKEIKEWLNFHNRDRYWLAEMLGMKKKSIDNWLSTTKKIPEAKRALILRVFQEEEAAEKMRIQQLQPQNQIFSIEVTLTEFRQIDYAAKLCGKTIEEWSREVLIGASRGNITLK